MKKVLLVALVAFGTVSFGFGKTGQILTYSKYTQEQINICNAICEEKGFECKYGPEYKPCETQKGGFMKKCVESCLDDSEYLLR